MSLSHFPALGAAVVAAGLCAGASPSFVPGPVAPRGEVPVPMSAHLPDFFQDDAGQVMVDGFVFDSLDDYIASDAFINNGGRCGHRPADHANLNLRDASDCSGNRTNPLPEYMPVNGPIYRIPVVVHVLRTSSGGNDISPARVQSQIDILNEDFRAIAGTNGAPGVDTRIEFFLATEDPQGNPTTGITYSNNSTWYNDGGSYWNSLSWDPDNYMNLYANSASGNLGYVPTLPQFGIAGASNDRVVVLSASFGRNAPIQNYNLGRTGTHEVGHYLGLEHTFSGGCGSSSCYTTGDLLCDTNRQSSPTFGCPGNPSSCGSSDPKENYMDYSYDACMNGFTLEQANRMRCTLMFYRPDLAIVAAAACSPADLTTTGNAEGEPDGTVDLSDFSYYLSIWSSSDTAADVTTTGTASGIPDGTVDLSDFSFYLSLWSAGCP